VQGVSGYFCRFCWCPFYAETAAAVGDTACRMMPLKTPEPILSADSVLNVLAVAQAEPLVATVGIKSHPPALL